MRNLLRFSLTTLLVSLTGCAVMAAPSRFQDSSWRKWKTEIQVRVYYDIGIVSDPAQGGGSVWIYGMRVEDDGSETPVWKRFLFERPTRLFSHQYEYLPLDADRVYLFFAHRRRRKDYPAFLEVNRKTGEVLRDGQDDAPYFVQLRKDHMWYQMRLIDRPAPNAPQPPTYERRMDFPGELTPAAK